MLNRAKFLCRSVMVSAWVMVVIVKYLFPRTVSFFHLSRVMTLAQDSSFTSVFLTFLPTLLECDVINDVSCFWSSLQSSTPRRLALTQFWFRLSVVPSFILAHLHFFLFRFPKVPLPLFLQVLTTSTYHYTLTWLRLRRPWPPRSPVWRSGTACG